ncbi:MAG: hypothetical protein MUP21_02385 [Dehalococcoidia bacterium]|nr:hypothetical protein [Dehalococcoidia bacterium]
MSSCPTGLTEEQKTLLRQEREVQLGEWFSRTILTDLMNIYVGQMDDMDILAGLDVMLGIDRRTIFLQSVKAAYKTMRSSGTERVNE